MASVLHAEAGPGCTLPLSQFWSLPLLDAGLWGSGALCVICPLAILHLVMSQNSGAAEARKEFMEG